MTTKITACYSNEGGAGKTVTAVNFAYALPAPGKRTLLFDLDPQGASSFYFRLKLSAKLMQAKFCKDVENVTNAIARMGIHPAPVMATVPKSAALRACKTLNDKDGQDRPMSNATEIERKFLVASCPALDEVASEAVRQGYVTGPEDSIEVRLRQKGRGYFLTVKSAGTLQRAEHETAITAEQFEILWPATHGRRIEKTRYTGTLFDGLIFELDIFRGTLAPLMLVEVEFATLDAANGFIPPDWFGADVTADKRFKNKALANVSSCG